MASIGEAAQLVGSLGSVAVAAVAIAANNRTTRANLDAQRQATADQLESQRNALMTTLAAQARQISDERLWDRRMSMYEDLGAWSGEAFAGASRFMFDVAALPKGNFAENFQEPWQRFSQPLGDRYFPLLGRVHLYASDDLRDAFLSAAPSITRMGGKYDKDTAVKVANAIFSAITTLQEELRKTMDRLSAPGSSSSIGDS
jgi:hypothetical protein